MESNPNPCWRSLTLNELTLDTPITYGVVKPGINGSIPFIRGGDISNGQVDVNQLRTISEAVSQQYGRTLLRGGELVVSLVGNPGQVAKVPAELAGANIARQVALVRINEDTDSDFVKYYLSSSLGQMSLSGYTMGSVQQVINLRDLKKIKIPVPPLPEQKAIAHILGSLDDKIELNRRMNATLEGMAQALFKSWFVDFDPVIDNALAAGNPIPEELAERAEVRRKALADGTANREVGRPFSDAFQRTDEMGWIPVGWEVKKAESIVDRMKVNQKFTKKNVLVSGNIPVFDQGTGLLLGFHNGLADVESSKMNPSFIFGDHTCITHLSIKPFSVGPNVIPLKAKNYDPYWTYFAIKDIQPFQEYRRHWMEFKIKEVLVPSEELASIFGNFIGDLYISMESNTDESTSLAKLRDTLLPKLISGELRIPETEKLTKEALA